jgi:hypothetical protein
MKLQMFLLYIIISEHLGTWMCMFDHHPFRDTHKVNVNKLASMLVFLLVHTEVTCLVTLTGRADMYGRLK